MKARAVLLTGGVGLILACLAMARVENLVEATPSSSYSSWRDRPG
jgi:hypothetical protein